MLELVASAADNTLVANP